MRWPCFLLLASLPLASAATAQTTGSASSPKSLTFDVAQVPATRDSFVFRLRGQERGWAVWQYEIRPLEMTQEVVYTAASEFRPVEEERLRVVVNRLTGQPISTFHHIDLFSPGTVLSDYVFLAGAVSNAVPGDSLGVPAYKEFDDSLVTLTFVAESPATIEVPAGRFDVLPLRSGGFRIYATRTGPRRVVKGETLDGAFSFELVRSGPVVPSAE